MVDVDRFPHGIADKDLMGVVTDFSSDPEWPISIKLDKKFDWLKNRDNAISVSHKEIKKIF